MKNGRRGELAVCGLESVKALADARPGAVLRFFFVQERVAGFGRLCSTLASLKRPYRLVEPSELEALSGTVHHQGVVAMIADVEAPLADDATLDGWAARGARVAVLDGVGDDHNIGSIARSAAFFGWDALVVGRDDGARLTTSAYRVARGALERIEVRSDRSAAAFVERCRGRIRTVGADHLGDADLRAVARSAPPGTPLTLVLGNEESGLTPRARAACDTLARIAGSGVVESLNVSQAAAVFLYELSAADPVSKPGTRKPSGVTGPRSPRNVL